MLASTSIQILAKLDDDLQSKKSAKSKQKKFNKIELTMSLAHTTLERGLKVVTLGALRNRSFQVGLIARWGQSPTQNFPALEA